MLDHIGNKCAHLGNGGYHFDRQYAPNDWLEGKRSSRVWIVGLNPATDIGENHTKTRDDLENYFVPGKPFYRYFEDFRHVSKQVYDGFGREGGTAHTDIVKCGSKRFPGGKEGAELVHHCSAYLKQQITELKPQLIICNGSPVSSYMQKEFPHNEDPGNTPTSYWTVVEGVEICVVLTGFIGRIDNYSRRRLGVEVDARLAEVISAQAIDRLLK